ncbi:purine-cytosine permease family protein [Nocardioides nitrophenolicus]|uniref:purine-cytosine permease family protein n=1 Tax=Nocardioides nitrophenolicus TaxID=60489 RepID=UPI00195B925A|nr:cytosine permease [Nocardioides nitrophenolicus]MBM7519720.1 purine-cytosine permease-like protein [Nocardioides nitrophenolicus]
MASHHPSDAALGAGAAHDVGLLPGQVEAHGIDVIPDAERTGTARGLFALWVAPNVNYLSFVVGGVLVLIGLSLAQAIAAVVVGCLFSIATGIVAVTGPVSGTPSQVATRAMYGVRGNRVAIAVNGWFVSVCYIALNWLTASVIGFALTERLGLGSSAPVQVAVVLVIASATTAISVYGQGLIMRLYGPLSAGLTLVFLLVSGYLVAKADLSYAPPVALHGADLWLTWVAGVTLIAATPLSYTISSDFARYLPRDTSPVAVATWTALGNAVPGVVLLTVGVLAATVTDLSDPEAGLAGIVPGWLVTLFLVAIIVGILANNALTTYSSGLALQAVGLPFSRVVSVIVTALVGVAMTLYALFVFDFLDTVSSSLVLLVSLVGPIMAIYVTDILIRRNAYDGAELSDSTPGSRYWYTGGVNLAGAIACLVSFAAALMCASTEAFTGPIARSLGGLDLSVPVGMIGAAVLYAGLTRLFYGRTPR